MTDTSIGPRLDQRLLLPEVRASPPLLLPPSSPLPHPEEGPEYLLLQAPHPLPVGPLPRLQRALCLHLGTAQALHLLLQLLLLLLLGLQPGRALGLQGCHLGLWEWQLVRGLALCTCAVCACKGLSGTSRSLKAPRGSQCKQGVQEKPLFVSHVPGPPGLQILGQGT